MQDWLDPFLTVEEQDRLLGWHLGVSPNTRIGSHFFMEGSTAASLS